MAGPIIKKEDIKPYGPKLSEVQASVDDRLKNPLKYTTDPVGTPKATNTNTFNPNPQNIAGFGQAGMPGGPSKFPNQPAATTYIDRLPNGNISYTRVDENGVWTKTELTQEQYNQIEDPTIIGNRGAKQAATPETARLKALQGTQPSPNAQYVSQVGQLTDEQLATAYSNPNIDMPLDENIRNIELQKSGLGALTSIGTGLGTAGIATAAGGVAAGTAATGGGLLAAGAAYMAMGGVKDLVNAYTGGTFEMYKHQATEKTEFVDNNVLAAQNNIRRAIQLAFKAGPGDLALKQFNDATAELVLAERQYKVLSQDNYEYTTNARAKMQELNNYMQGTFEMQKQLMATALQKPDPSYVDPTLNMPAESE